MTGRPRRLAATALVVLLVLTGTAGSASADEWRTSVLLPGAPGDHARLRDATTVTTTGVDGAAHVFVSADRGGQVRHVVQTRTGWRTTATPWAGSVLAAASDATGQYVLLLDRSSAFAVAQRTAAGRYAAPVRLRQERGRVSSWAAALLATGGTWQAFLSYAAADGPDSPGRGSGLLTASSTAPTALRVLRPGGALTLAAAWLPGRVAALVVGDEASQRLLFGRGVGSRWAFGLLAPGFDAPVDAVGGDGRLAVAWIDGRDVLTRESDGRSWGPVSRAAVLPGNRGAVQVAVARGRTLVGWSSLRAVVDAPVRDAVLVLSERSGGGPWRTAQVSRGGSPVVEGLTVDDGRPTLVHRLQSVRPGEVRAATRLR